MHFDGLFPVIVKRLGDRKQPVRDAASLSSLSWRLVLPNLKLTLVKLHGTKPGKILSSSENDDLCSICADGGDLLCCDHCPKAFHKGVI